MSKLIKVGPMLVRLVETPIDNLTGFVLSAYKPDTEELDLDYVAKYKDAYTSFLATSMGIVVETRTKKEAPTTFEKAKLLRSLLLRAGYRPAPETDLSRLIEQMEFKSVQTDASEDPLSEVPEVDEDAKRTLSAVVDATLATLEDLYSNVFSPLHPVGVYSFRGEDEGYANGFIRHNTAHNKENLKSNLPGNDSKVTPTSSDAMMHIKMICKRIGLDQFIDTGYVSAKELGVQGRHYYFSSMQGKLASGVVKNNQPSYKNWKNFKTPLRKWVEGHLGQVLKEYGNIDRSASTEEQLEQTKELNKVLSVASANLTNSVLVEVLDVKTAYLLVLKVCAPNLLGGEETLRDTINGYIKSLGSSAVALRGVTTTKASETAYPVYTITVALNSELEAKAPMYAFQVWEDMETAGDLREIIGTHNIIFGRNADGSLNAYNMKSPLNAIERHTAVVAGSGSGKGLTTLAAVASTAMHGQPVFYLDGKPDMAKAFWRYLADHPDRSYHGRAFAFDGVKPWETPVNISADPAKFAHNQAPEQNRSIPDDALNGLVQLKAMSLMLALQEFTADGALTPRISELLGYDIKRGGLFVFDELQKNTAQGLEPLLRFLKSWKANTRKDADDDPAEQYRRQLKSFVDNVMSQIFGYHKALGRKTNISTFTIFQALGYADKINPERPADYGGFIGLRTLIGKIDGDQEEEKYMKTQTASPTVKRAFDNFQWFDIRKGPAAAKASLSRRPETEHTAPDNPLTSPIKPFLLFNDENNIREYLAGVEATLPTHVRQLIDEEMARGDKNRLHTAGLLNYYGVDLADSLVLGYDVMQNFLRLAGFIGSVTDYVLSPHIDTLVTSSQLVAQAQKTVDTEPNLTLPAPLTPECIYTPEEAGTSVSVDINDGDMAVDFDDDGDMSADFDLGDDTPKQHTDDFFQGETDLPPMPDFGTTERVLSGQEQSNPFKQQQQQQEQPKQQQQQQEKPKRPYFIINGLPFVQDAEGNFHHAEGRYAPLHTENPSTYAGATWGSAPIIENDKPSPFKRTSKGGIEITDPTAMAYAEPFIGTEVSYKGKLKQIFPELSEAKFEKAVSQRWYVLMRAIAKSAGGVKHIAHLRIGENLVYVNGSPLAASAEIIDGTGLRITDLVDYPALFKYFKELRRLDLEHVAYPSFTSAYGKPSIPFTKHKHLQEINFQNSDGKYIQYNRVSAAGDYDVPPNRLHAKFNTWTAMASQVNQGKTSSFMRPGTRLRTADWTARLAKGTFGKSDWTLKRRALGFVGMALAGAATVVTGGVQVARASKHKLK